MFTEIVKEKKKGILLYDRYNKDSKADQGINVINGNDTRIL